MDNFIDRITEITDSLFSVYLPTLTDFWLSNPILTFILTIIVFNFVIDIFRKVRNKTQL